MRRRLCIDCQECAARTHGIFKGLQEPHLSELLQAKSTELYSSGSTIFQEGNRPFGLYAVQKGKIKIFKRNPDGKEQIIRLAKDGDLLGYRSVISDEYYNASASCLEDSAVCFIPKNVFLDLVRKDPSVSREMLLLLTDALKQAEERIKNMAQKSLRSRLAYTLLLLNELFGTKESQPLIDVRLTREELANLIGSALVCAIRILSEFRKEGIVETEDRKLRILDLNRVNQIAFAAH